MKTARATKMRELVEIGSPVEGVVTRLFLRVGHSVKSLEDLLVVTDKDGQETTIQSDHAGIITAIYITGDGTCRVGNATVLMTIDISPNALQQLRDRENGSSAESQEGPEEDATSVTAAVAHAEAKDAGSPPRDDQVQYGAAAIPEGAGEAYG